jgi:exopolyphosphatase / guanosine-5'-triphosphate,3'-diphosphate pyrophosphatase
MNIAVIDLGTNGFRLQIAETTEGGQYTIIHHSSNELQLASEGIHHIGNAPFKRGLEAMTLFADTLKKYNVKKIKAFATAALRIADNGQHFIETVSANTGIQIELISGEREAELIYKGMRLGIPIGEAPVVMIDIGGGSVEFIIANKSRMLWAESFNVGVAILKQRFHLNDPITLTEIDSLKAFLNQETHNFIEQISVFKPKTPIIASGTLDYMVKILRGYTKPYFDMPYSTYSRLYNSFIFLTEKELKAIPEIPQDKIEMNAVSMILVHWIMEKLQTDSLIASQNSMKAGVLYELSFN